MQLCSEIVYNILIVPELSNLALNMFVILAETTQLGKLFHVFTTLFEKLNFRKSYLTLEL